jgi:hypothetical protein
MEASDQKHTPGAGAADAARKDEATSTDTLADLEDTQKVSSTDAADDSAPAPDGTPEPDRGATADGDPM